MSKFSEYIQDTTNELTTKVSWPTWSELQGSAVVVMVASVIIALVVLVMDTAFSKLMETFYQLFQ